MIIVTSALVFDLDDTLLSRSKKVSDRNAGALKECLKSGIRIIIATSRPKRAVRGLLDDDLLKNCCLITLNGAVFEYKGLEHQVSSIDSHVVDVLQKTSVLVEPNVSIELRGDHFSTNKELTDEELATTQSATRDLLIPITEIHKHSVSKIAVHDEGRNISHFIGAIQASGIKTISALNDTWVNIVASGVDKATTLSKVADLLNVQLSEMISFGDDTPDIEMMKLTGRSVAMGNASSGVRDVATASIGDCDSDAICDYLYEEVLGCMS